MNILVDGGWGDWSTWETCPVSCGGGYQNRTRLCDSPSPQFEGEDCTVDGSLGYETQNCNENPCASTQNYCFKNKFRFNFNGVILFRR